MKYLMAVMMSGALLAPGSVSASEDPGDAPEHGVARISFLSGDVTVRRGDSGEVVEAELNVPLVSLDHVITDDRSRAEIQFDWATFLRIAPESEVRLAELHDRDFLVQVVSGTVTVRVLRDSSSKIEISAPMASLVPRDDGTYRITVRDDFSSEMTVRSGEAQVFVDTTRTTVQSGEARVQVDHTSELLRKGQTLFLTGDPSDTRRAFRAAIPEDAWDRWNEDRDRELSRSDSYRYVSRDIYGAEALSHHGRWVYDAPYGWVWAPNVYVGWAPYRVGRWVWLDYYGWTWVSGDPWGWAPYHYGRWYYGPRYGWVWYPGSITVRYTWRPALVGFFGWGVNVGWVPLAPYEVYRPWYGSGRTVVVDNVRVVNNINVINTYHNARFVSGRSGATSVTYVDFGKNRTTVNNFIVGTDRDFSRADHADRLHARRPDRENRELPDRRGPDRINASMRASRQPIENVRRTESRRIESSASERTRNGNPDTRVLRSSEETGRRPEPSRGRAFEDGGTRNERVNNSPSRTTNEENGRRSEPRQNDSAAANRSEPTRDRTLENNRSRNDELLNSRPSRSDEDAGRGNARRSDPGRGRSDERDRPAQENPRRAEPARSEPERLQPGNSENARRAAPPPTSSPGVRSRQDDNDRPPQAGQRRTEPASSEPEQPRPGNSENARRAAPPPTSSPGVRSRQDDNDRPPQAGQRRAESPRSEPERPRPGNSESARRVDPPTSSPGVRSRQDDNDRPPQASQRTAESPRSEPERPRPGNSESARRVDPPPTSSPGASQQGAPPASQDQGQQPEGNPGRGRGNGRR